MGNNTTLPFKLDSTQLRGSDPFLDLTKIKAVDGSSASISAQQGSPFWGDSPKTWDIITLGDFSLPGLATVKGRIGRRKDKKKVTGINGNVLTDTGADAAEIQVQLRMWTREHWDAFKQLAGMIRPGPNQPPPKAFDIAHPAIAAFGIKSVEVTSSSLPYMLSSNVPDVYACDLVLLEVTIGTGKAKGAVNTNKSSQSLGNVLKERTNAALPQVSFEPKKPSEKTLPTGKPDANASYLPSQTSSQP